MGASILVVLLIASFASLFSGGPGTVWPQQDDMTIRHAWEISAAPSSEPRDVATRTRAEFNQGSDAYVSFFPNPARDRATFLAREICWCRVTGIRVLLYDVRGTLVRVVESGTASVTLDLVGGPRLANGTYIAAFELRVDKAWGSAGASLLTILH